MGTSKGRVWWGMRRKGWWLMKTRRMKKIIQTFSLRMHWTLGDRERWRQHNNNETSMRIEKRPWSMLAVLKLWWCVPQCKGSARSIGSLCTIEEWATNKGRSLDISSYWGTLMKKRNDKTNRMENGAKANHSCNKLVEGFQTKNLKIWRGPLVAMKFHHEAFNS